MIESMLTKLGYDPKWFTYGFLEVPFLREQSEHYDNGIDKNTEHYRYEAFRRLLESLTSIDNHTFDRYIELAELDEDKAMANAALSLLIRHPSLTHQQLEQIKSLPALAEKTIQKIIEETQLLQELDASAIQDGVFDRCMTLAKSSVQRKLLSKSGITAFQLELLRDHGASRAIRNLAQERLRRLS